jgi:methyl-accepting chemotaxis protein
MNFNILNAFKDKVPVAPKAAPMDRNVLTAMKQKVLDYSTRGYSESEIIDTLQNEGYTFEQIDLALTEALKSGVEGDYTPSPQAQSIKKGFDFNTQYNSTDDSFEDLSPISQGVSLSISPEEMVDKKVEQIEEMVESLIDEKIARVEEAVGNIKDAFYKFNENLGVLQQAMTELQKNIDNLNREFKEHNNAVDQRFEDFQPRINSLEKAFKDTVPNLVDSIREVREMHEKDSLKKDKKDAFGPYH